MSDLDKLIASVERDEHRNYIGLSQSAGFTYKQAYWINSAFNESLDAAKALHESLLGDAHWSVAEDDDYGFCGKVYFRQWFHEHSDVAARSWLLAILKAYRSMKEGDA